jgi:hypothetical protein
VTGDAPKFKPKPLSKASIEAPMEARWRVMGPDEARRLHAVAQSEHRRFNPFGPRLRKRFLTISIGTSVAFMVLGWLVVSGTSRVFLPFGGVGLALGAVVAIVRPYDYLAGALYALASLAAALVMHVPLFVTFAAAGVFYMIGITTGRVEEGKSLDGE